MKKRLNLQNDNKHDTIQWINQTQHTPQVVSEKLTASVTFKVDGSGRAEVDGCNHHITVIQCLTLMRVFSHLYLAFNIRSRTISTSTVN